MVQSRLGGAVVGTTHHWHECHLRGSEYKRGLFLLGLQVWEKCLGEVNRGGVVCHQLLVENGDVDGIRFGEVERPLDSGVYKDAVDVRVLVEDF